MLGAARRGARFQQRGARGGFHLHGLGRRVAQGDLGTELVAFTHQGRQAADDLQVLRTANGGRARAKQADTGIGHGDDAKARQRIVQRHGDLGLALVVELDHGLPQQQRVEQFTRGCAAATAAGWRGFLAVVAPADDFHLRRGRLHAPGAALQHGAQQVPTGVGHKFKQRFIHRGQRHFGVRGRFAVRQRGRDADLRLAAHRVAGLVGRHLHIDAVRCRAHLDFGHAKAEGRFAQVHKGGGQLVLLAVVPEGAPPFARCLVAPGEEAVPGHFAQAAAQRQHADVHVRPPTGLHLERHARVLARERHHLRFENAFALHRHQGSGFAKRHAHLQAHGLTRLVAAPLGQHVDAVVVLAAKPLLARTADPDGRGRIKGVAVLVARGGDKFDLAYVVELRLAQQQAARVALAGAQGAQVARFGVVVVAVEAADDALPAARRRTRQGLHLHRHAGLRLAVG